MTVVLEFTGGPKDGGWKRVSSEDLHKGAILVFVVNPGCGVYVSNGPYDGGESHVGMSFEYDTEIPHLSQRINW